MNPLPQLNDVQPSEGMSITLHSVVVYKRLCSASPNSTEFKNDSKDVLGDIGCVWHQVPLQIALFKNVEMAKLLILLMTFLTDGPDSYNPVMVNRLHEHVLFQSVLTTLLAVVNRLLWIVGLLLHQWRLMTRIQSITERNRLIFHGSTVLYLAMEN